MAGGDDPTVLRAMSIAQSHALGSTDLWSARSRESARSPRPRGSISRALSIARRRGAGDRREGRGAGALRAAAALMKGQIPTPDLMKAVLDPTDGLRTERVICQVVLMEIRPRRAAIPAGRHGHLRAARRLDDRIDILGSTVELARMLGATRPRVALMAATETVKPSMPETVEWAELTRRGAARRVRRLSWSKGRFRSTWLMPRTPAPRSTWRAKSAARPTSCSFRTCSAANLTVKAIMYTADCRVRRSVVRHIRTGRLHVAGRFDRDPAATRLP